MKKTLKGKKTREQKQSPADPLPKVKAEDATGAGAKHAGEPVVGTIAWSMANPHWSPPPSSYEPTKNELLLVEKLSIAFGKAAGESERAATFEKLAELERQRAEKAIALGKELVPYAENNERAISDGVKVSVTQLFDAETAFLKTWEGRLWRNYKKALANIGTALNARLAIAADVYDRCVKDSQYRVSGRPEDKPAITPGSNDDFVSPKIVADVKTQIAQKKESRETIIKRLASRLRHYIERIEKDRNVEP